MQNIAYCNIKSLGEKKSRKQNQSKTNVTHNHDIILSTIKAETFKKLGKGIKYSTLVIPILGLTRLFGIKSFCCKLMVVLFKGLGRHKEEISSLGESHY